MNDQLSQARLMELVKYDSETGVFTWIKTRTNTAFAGAIAGSVSKSYVVISIDGCRYKAHRLAWLYVHGSFPEGILDHINGIKSDNRIANLRECNKVENGQNRTVTNKNNSTGYIGVSWRKREGKFGASIGIEGKRKFLGNFDTAEEAHEAYLKAKQEIHTFQPTLPK